MHVLPLDVTPLSKHTLLLLKTDLILTKAFCWVSDNFGNEFKVLFSGLLSTISLNIEDSRINYHLMESNLIVNTTSLGMTGGPDPDNDLIGSYEIQPGTIGYDLVYSPKETPFLKKIRDKKGISASGLSMLVFQGIEGFKLSTGIEPPEKLMLDITNSES